MRRAIGLEPYTELANQFNNLQVGNSYNFDLVGEGQIKAEVIRKDHAGQVKVDTGDMQRLINVAFVNSVV